MDTRSALSEFVLNDSVYIVDQRISRENVELMVVRLDGEEMECYRGLATVEGLKPEGFRTKAYVETLRNALRVQDTSGQRYAYEIAEQGSDRALRFVVRFKIEAGDAASLVPRTHQSVDAAARAEGWIFIQGAEVILRRVPNPTASFFPVFFRRMTIASGELLASQDAFKQLQLERDRYSALSQNAAALKSAAETRILHMVVRLVNEKKEKISSLLAAGDRAAEAAKQQLAAAAQQAAAQRAELARAEAEVVRLKAQLAAAALPGGGQTGKPTPGALSRAASQATQGSQAAKKRKVVNDSVGDSYPDFTTIAPPQAGKPGSGLQKQQSVSEGGLFRSASAKQVIARNDSDVSRTSADSVSPKKARAEAPPRNNDVITAHDLLDSD
ncbi:hypothetical protein DIPPA_06177 [Diplonema papillatum]|nr:hypothetical protein DIPPA_06177 [Diplonema papillatum]